MKLISFVLSLTVLLAAVAVAACVAGAKTSTPAGWTDDCDAALKRAAAEKKLIVAEKKRSGQM